MLNSEIHPHSAKCDPNKCYKSIQQNKKFATHFQESEARTELLRNQSRKRLEGSEPSSALVPAPKQHVNFFEDLEQGVRNSLSHYLYQLDLLLIDRIQVL